MTLPLLHGTTTQTAGCAMFARTGGVPGSGTAPVILVHGAVISGRYMVPTARRLAASHQVYVPDLPGFGRSEQPHAPLDVPGLARALLAWMDAVGIGRAHLLGNSLGTQVAVDLAMRWPARAASLILVGPTVDRTARTRRHQLWRLARDAFLERASLIPLHLGDVVRAGWRFAYSALDVAITDRIEDKLPAVRCPVLIVCGDHDPLAPAEWCRWLATQSPHATMTTLPGPHALNYSRPQELSECVRMWLRTVDSVA